MSFLFLISCIRGQEISFKLDSIHQLNGSDYEKLYLYLELFSLYEKNEDFTQLGHDAHQLGKWIHKEQKWNKAIDIIKIAYEAREKAEPYNIELLKRSYFNYAIYNKRLKNYSVAIFYFKKMLGLGGTDFLRGRAYAIIGECYSILGDYHTSIDYQQKSLQNYSKSDIQKGRLIDGNIYIASTYGYIRSEESSKKAILHLKKAESLLKKQPKSNLYNSYLIYNNLGNLYCEGVKTKDLNKCIECYSKALKILHDLNIKEKLPRIYYNLGLTHIETDTTLSGYYFQQALKYSNHNPSFKHNIFFGLGIKDLYSKNYIKAHEKFSNSFSLLFNKKISNIYWLPEKDELKIISDKVSFLELIKRKLRTWIELGKSKKESIYFNEAIRTTYKGDELIDLLLQNDISNQTKLLWRSLASQIYIMGIETCIHLKNHKDAFYFMEKSKALLLTQEVTKNKIDIPINILEQETKIETEIVRLRKLLYETNETLKDSISEILLGQKNNLQLFKDSLSSQYPTYFSSISNPKIIPLSEIKLKSDEVIIEYIMVEKVAQVLPEAYGMYISNDKKMLFNLKNNEQLLDKIESLREKLKAPFTTAEDIYSYQKVANQLYKILFPPEIRDPIKNKKVTIVTDHFLGFIPFEALVTNLDTGRYLIEDSEVNHTYSLSFQQENSTIPRQAEKEFLGVAPVNFSNELSDLYESEVEINNANTFYDGSLLIKKNATKKNFMRQASEYKILHLATHAYASDSIAPWIAFHESKLTMDELNIIKNNAELVVLSACNTSLGKLKRGEGVMSLARGFFKSGANTVIPSLWSTNDKATATITTNFYKHLSQGQTKSEALRTAKLDYLHNNTDAEASPHYWASLVLIGDTGVLVPKSNNLWIFFLGFGVVLLILMIYRFFF
ncbi:CHAT domain-containing protein [Aquimarina sp. D1M17]|nr:CHAT domain-containing protein [Aquimarina acroporae]